MEEIKDFRSKSFKCPWGMISGICHGQGENWLTLFQSSSERQFKKSLLEEINWFPIDDWLLLLQDEASLSQVRVCAPMLAGVYQWVLSLLQFMVTSDFIQYLETVFFTVLPSQIRMASLGHLGPASNMWPFVDRNVIKQHMTGSVFTIY